MRFARGFSDGAYKLGSRAGRLLAVKALSGKERFCDFSGALTPKRSSVSDSDEISITSLELCNA